MTDELAAFRAVDFDWVRPLQSVWQDPPFHVDALYGDVVEDVLDDFARVKQAAPQSGARIGRVVVGRAGAGKTHLIGTLRQRVCADGGWFVLIDIVGIKDFWETAALGFITSLEHPMPDGRPQHQAICLAAFRNIPRAIVNQFGSEAGQKRETTLQKADFFLRILQRAFPGPGLQHRDTVRALLLLSDADLRNHAFSWLHGLNVGYGEGAALGFHARLASPVDLVRGVSWLMSLAGPTMIAVDQIDAIVTESNADAASPADENTARARSILDALAGGLMDLKDVTKRAMTVVTCLGETWSVLRDKTLASATQRFAQPSVMATNSLGASLAAILEDRLAQAYRARAFEPPYPTWPFKAASINAATIATPRELLMRCDEHQRACRSARTVWEYDFAAQDDAVPPVAAPALDARLAALKAAASIDDLLDVAGEGDAMGALLRDTLGLYVREVGPFEHVDVVVSNDSGLRRPPLHARLTFIHHDQGDRERHFCFRAIEHTHHSAVQPRLRAAMTAAGVDQKLKFRHLFIIRNIPLPGGKVTADLVRQLERDGGRVVAPHAEDLKTFVALRTLRGEAPDGFDDWLRMAKPLAATAFFKAVGLSPPPQLETDVQGQTHAALPIIAVPDAPSPEPVTSAPQPRAMVPPAPAAGSIPLGRRLEGGGLGRAQSLPLALLPRHTIILGGPGSGKTVLLRRMIEEAALQGVPAIVLDPNNDLARLGEPWPTPPLGLSAEDQSKADALARTVETVVWTPNMSEGRPLSLALLPDLSSLAGDERAQAIDLARETLLPFVSATGSKGRLKSAVLVGALHRFADRPSGDLEGIIALLADLPDDVSDVGQAQKLAAEMADQLRAARTVNPVLRSNGAPVDPAALFAGADGRTRISVVNLSGLAAADSRQAFVNQLQMTLFTWIKAHPSPVGRLYVIDEAQTFVPSMIATPCKASALALAAQARKYGLGMIMATQLPRGIDTGLVSNATSHFYGRMSSPATIDATKEMMDAKGGAANDLGRLERGTFYFSTEGLAKPVKLATPLCLSHHPANPLTASEVVALARRGPAARRPVDGVGSHGTAPRPDLS